MYWRTFMATIVLTGGGTGGHVIPNIALLNELYKYFDSIHYIGSNGIEEKLIKNENIPFHKTSTIKLDRSKLLSNAKIPFLLTKGIFEAKEILSNISPNVIFSKGGYVSLPTCYAAKILNIPIVCHESDYTLGVANKLVSKFAKVTLTSFPETEQGVFVGNPIREEIYKKSFKVTNTFKLNHNKKTILVSGGSLGSIAINKIIYDLLPKLQNLYNIIHISGNYGDFSVKAQNYIQLSYTDNFAEALALSDLVICRSGANTLAEVAALGKRCITIPLPKGASRGDQLLNALSYKNRGFCEILLQDELSPATLNSLIEIIWHKKPPVLNVLEINEKIVKHILSAM